MSAPCDDSKSTNASDLWCVLRVHLQGVNNDAQCMHGRGRGSLGIAKDCFCTYLLKLYHNNESKSTFISILLLKQCKAMHKSLH